MASVMSSRFSVLKIEDDSDMEAEILAKEKAMQDKNKKKPTKKRKKAKEITFDADLQAMAFGLPRTKPNKSKSKKSADSPQKTSECDTQEWERRDKQLVDSTFESDIQQAVLLSKVEFERNESTSNNLKSNGAPTTDKSRPKKGKQTFTISVDQLQTLSNTQIDGRKLESDSAVVNGSAPVERDRSDFFLEADRRAQDAITREHIASSIAADRSAPAGTSELESELRQQLALRDDQLKELQQQREQLQEDVKLTKKRVKRLLDILRDTETSEKAQLVVAVEKAVRGREEAEREKAEMSQQVTAVLAQLEQERSRVHALTTQLRKSQDNKRRGVSESAADDQE